MRVAEVPAEGESEGSLARADGSVRSLRQLVSSSGMEAQVVETLGRKLADPPIPMVKPRSVQLRPEKFGMSRSVNLPVGS